MKLMLGSVQFGLDYGITNVTGQTSLEEVKKILTYARSLKIESIDTARSYGNSETVLGTFSEDLKAMKVVTKFAYLDQYSTTPRESLKLSLANLNLDHVYGVMFHNPDDLLSANANAYLAEVEALKAENKYLKWGVSVYSPRQLQRILDVTSLDLVQIPLNLLDQRLLKDNFLKKLKSLNIEIHVRSVFLQGLLLSPIESLHPYFGPILPMIRKIHHQAQEEKISLLSFLLNFVESIEEVDKVVVGVNNLEQLKEIVLASRIDKKIKYENYAIDDEAYLLPMNWKTK